MYVLGTWICDLAEFSRQRLEVGFVTFFLFADEETCRPGKGSSPRSQGQERIQNRT